METVTKKMLKIYVPYSNMDWLNYKLIKKDLTFHHLVKREEGGKEVVENGALLMPSAHQYLHIIEYKDINTYNAINKLFTYINRQEAEPTLEQRLILEYLLVEFEKIHANDKTSKGKLLIKHKYLERAL